VESYCADGAKAANPDQPIASEGGFFFASVRAALVDRSGRLTTRAIKRFWTGCVRRSLMSGNPRTVRDRRLNRISDPRAFRVAPKKSRFASSGFGAKKLGWNGAFSERRFFGRRPDSKLIFRSFQSSCDLS